MNISYDFSYNSQLLSLAPTDIIRKLYVTCPALDVWRAVGCAIESGMEQSVKKTDDFAKQAISQILTYFSSIRSIAIKSTYLFTIA